MAQAQAQAQDIFTRGQAVGDLSDLYEGGEVEELLSAADTCGFFADEIFIRGELVRVCVRRAPAGYEITRS